MRIGKIITLIIGKITAVTMRNPPIETESNNVDGIRPETQNQRQLLIFTFYNPEQAVYF